MEDIRVWHFNRNGWPPDSGESANMVDRALGMHQHRRFHPLGNCSWPIFFYSLVIHILKKAGNNNHGWSVCISRRWLN